MGITLRAPLGNGATQARIDLFRATRVWRRLRWVLVTGACGFGPITVRAQDTLARPGTSRAAGPDSAQLSLSRAKVDVTPVARDEQIRTRLESVLAATNWFTAPRVRVDAGVVFLDGRVASEERRGWATELARNTQGVVAVANRMQVPEPSIWDFQPASRGLMKLWRDVIQRLPWLAFAAVILAASLTAGLLTSRGAGAFLERHVAAQLLRRVMARAAGVLVFLLGCYIILRVMGLTQLALTVVGGTGLIGLAVGLAFRDITENFLASIFLSVQRPFEPADLIEVGGVTGYVQQLNLRTTILMNLDGNVVQIPNATVYKSTLRNYTTNCNRREVFDVGIGYDDSINDAQEIAREVLANHPAVLNDPEPAVLVNSLGASTVDLRVYFWLNGRDNSWLKVRSSVIRLVKRAFQDHGISMPDEAREILFPQGVPVTIADAATGDGAKRVKASKPISPTPPEEVRAVSTKAEAGLYSDAVVIEEQARQAQPQGSGAGLLEPAPDGGA